MLVQYYNNISNHVDDDKINLVYSIWFVRKISLAICVFSLFYTYCSHKDEHLENYKVLRRIENRLNSLENTSQLLETPAISKFT